MATELQKRGMDATGFALMSGDGVIKIYKGNEPAWKFVTTKDFHEFMDKYLTPEVHTLLVHTRSATKGSSFDNENNHPITAGQGVIIHNGMIRNDDALFDANKKLKAFKRSCKTDSDIFRAFLDNWGCIDRGLIKDMQKIEGVAAVCAIHPNSPDKLLLLRDSNPFVIGATQDMLFGASDKTAIFKAARPWTKLHNIPMLVHTPDLHFVTMPNQTGWIVGPKGFECHEEFRCNGRGSGGYTKYYKRTDYWYKRKTQEMMSDSKGSGKKVIIINSEDEQLVSKEIAAARTNPTLKNPAKMHTYPPELGPVDTSGSLAIVPANGTDNDSEIAEVEVLTGAKLLPDYVICNKRECSSHVELSEDERKLPSLAYLACQQCSTNLAEAPAAGLLN